MDRTQGISPGGIAKPGSAPPRPAKAHAFKQAMARAMEGAGPPARLPAPAAAARPAENAFRARIALAESSARAPGQGLGARNPGSGALGRYQITPQALRDLGWQDAGGQWTMLAARHGVRSEADFLTSAPAQEAAIEAYLRRAEQQLDRNGSLARAGGSVTGLDGQAVPLTEAGLVAAAHRRGAGSVARYLAHRTGTPDAPLSQADRSAFAAVEGRLRDFAALPYGVASREGSTRNG
ncbi:hypothetical protein JMJ56_23465 [Belnapia sp. T18]|uniref:Phage tail lysozyme domain-containing protein n=1 Tax=Belnapia arida TaxID=2804533 RepID=A0ABS1UBB6_9PROT|nr:hypothetical protein [Belnapia arida]MBL6080977.1 hypothetical protein [Belnapia arida]